MRRHSRTCAITSCLAVCAASAAANLSAQAVAFRVGAIDMCGGAVFAPESKPGVAFGARVGLLDLFNHSMQAAFELDWWTAERDDFEFEVHDFIAGIAILRRISGTGTLRPFLGLGAALHSVTTSRLGGERLSIGESPEAERLSGYRAGASGFAGLTVRLTRTGSIWLVAEYRYTAISEVSHHELRGGARLLAVPP